ncbi:MAG: radical SAM protein [Planctomycetes bacterium]|nr:radical SAM protein [Planctomycetota bacterium]
MAVRRLHTPLPIYAIDGERTILYAPGHLAVVSRSEARAVEAALLCERESRDASSALGRVARDLRSSAQNAVSSWRARVEAPFAPECLTVSLEFSCNLACAYCFSSPRGRAARQSLDERALDSAARWVAERTAAKSGKRFHLVVAGAGEPTLRWEMLQRLVALTRRQAAMAGLGWFGYIATSGVIPADRARWLAREFDMVGVSCDGPPDIQDRQRPFPGGGSSSAAVEGTAHVLAEAGGRLTVRSTITPETVERQAEIVAYLHDRLGATRIRFEPVYRVNGFSPDDGAWFAENFLAARAKARELGCELSLSGVRLDEVHGPYCNVLRDVLQLASDGSVAGCFLRNGAGEGADLPPAVGRWDPATGEWLLDMEAIAAHRGRAGRIPDRCQECLAAYSCARDCPDVCPVVARADCPPGFRCQVQRELALAFLLEAAAEAR